MDSNSWFLKISWDLDCHEINYVANLTINGKVNQLQYKIFTDANPQNLYNIPSQEIHLRIQLFHSLEHSYEFPWGIQLISLFHVVNERQ